ncbi:MAG: lipopolysaccharide transport periplasmic protein LptA [Gammaproteobacteria bacterium]|nr:lipopolysaccharide transport periplasmic protein LptA [Gammaproteobacteria bacterium]
MNKVKTFSQAVLFVLLCYPLIGLTLSTDRNQPIDIQADKLDINDKQHISIYQGHVVMRQGSLHIQADKITFHFNPQNDLQRLEIEGSPATLKQLNNKNEPVSGTAKKIIYTDDLLLLKLNGNARFMSNSDTIESEWITINTQTEALKAGGEKGDSRVRMLIQPKSTQSSDKNNDRAE